MRLRAVAALLVLWPAVARADANDLVLSRLGTAMDLNGDGIVDDVIPNNQEFRSLMSELGVAIAPKFLTPADTLGYSGFQFSSELYFTSINHHRGYWCATEESTDCSAAATKPGGWLPAWGLLARKGIWLPLPSFELGAGAIQIIDSSMWVAQAYAKFALHEGFHDWPIPSLAARGAVSRLMGSEQVDLTVASLDVSISKQFGVEGTVRLGPYAGWNVLWIIPRSEVIDKTPNVDVRDDPNDVRMNFVFPNQDNIIRHRFFGGLKIKYYVFALTAEVNVALAGDSVDDRGGVAIDCEQAPAAEKGRCDARDHAGSQQTYSIAVSLDF